MGSRISQMIEVLASAAAILLIATPHGAQTATSVQAPPSSQAKADPWAPFRFLMGRWVGVGSGKPGEALSGSTSFELRLDGQILVRDNRAEYAPAEGGKGPVVHTDLMVIYRDAASGGFRADYFDNEGHVIHYAVTFPAAGTSAVLETEPGGKGPRFRLVYEPAPGGGLAVDFLIAPPGGEFKSYVKGALKRAG